MHLSVAITHVRSSLSDDNVFHPLFAAALHLICQQQQQLGDIGGRTSTHQSVLCQYISISLL